MDGDKVAEILYAEFGHDRFLTHHIPEEVMNRLAGAMAIPGTGQSRKIKVGQALSNMGAASTPSPPARKSPWS